MKTHFDGGRRTAAAKSKTNAPRDETMTTPDYQPYIFACYALAAFLPGGLLAVSALQYRAARARLRAAERPGSEGGA